METVKEIKKTLSEEKNTLSKKYGIERIGLFGSFIRGEQDKKSDIDILVDFKEPVGLFTFVEIEEYLEKKLGRKVDLVSRKALKPTIGKYILREVLYV